MAGGKSNTKQSKGGKATTSNDRSSKNPKASSSKDDSGQSKLKPATAINTRHILCEKHSRHLAALEALSAPGAKFDDVAREYSEDKARQGGSLGWKTRGSLDADFEKVAYGLEPSSVASPKWGVVKTGFGYHVIMVEGRR